MCVILDTNAFGDCFNPSPRNGNKFKPVRDWIRDGKGKLVFGGKKYKRELAKAEKYLRLFSRLDTARKVVRLCDKKVDKKEKEIRKLESKLELDGNFNDHHLTAIVIVSGCTIIATKDRRAIRFLKDSRFYDESDSEVPRLYTTARNASLLTDHDMADICRPSTKLSKSEVAQIQGL